MALLLYNAEHRMAIADDPMSLSDEAASEACSDTGPLTLQDWQTYFVKFYGDAAPSFFPQPGKNYYQRSFGGQLFEIGFRNAVGQTRIGPICVRVASRKISETVYEAMLDYIAGKYANLIFSFATPLGQSYMKEKVGQDITYIEYLFLKKYLLDSSPNLDGIAALILANPHHRINKEFRFNTIDAIVNVPPTMLINMFSAPDRFAELTPGHPLGSTACGRAIFSMTRRRLYPAEAIEERKYHTVDTNENRFVKHFLQSVQRRLNSLAKTLIGRGGGYLNPDIETCLEQMKSKIGLLLSDPLWSEVGAMHFIPAGSQVLQRRDGYRQLFRLYSLLQLATHCNFNDEDFKNLLEMKDTPTLFEYWSFFVVKDILDGMRKILVCKTIVPDAALEQRVTPGICIQYAGGISLWFNRPCAGSPGFIPSEVLKGNLTINDSYSHNLRPDIMITRDRDILIFDAKYKGQRGAFYGESDDGTIRSCKPEDIDKMHTYRDAIRDAVSAFILYPGEEPLVYTAHNAQGPYQGVGALPLKPDAGARPVTEHLEYVKMIIRDFIKES